MQSASADATRRTGPFANDQRHGCLGTLDAIHLATALLWRDRIGPLPQLVTHAAALGAAARGFGFDVRGI